jgi:hypothetical protein
MPMDILQAATPHRLVATSSGRFHDPHRDRSTPENFRWVMHRLPIRRELAPKSKVYAQPMMLFRSLDDIALRIIL